MASTDGFATAVQTKDGATVSRLVSPLASNARVERLEVLDSDGARLKTMALTDSETLTYSELTDTDDP